MSRPKEVIDANLASQAEAAIKSCREHKVGLRLQAIASCAKHPVNLVGEVNGVSRQTVWRWIKRFKSGGVSGLHDKAKGHRPAKLKEEHQKIIRGWLEGSCNGSGEPVHWTLVKMAAEIKKEFGIRIGLTALSRLFHKMGFRQKVPRPSHAKADRKSQEAFKKNA